MMAIQVASLLSGAVITETVFAIPGIGRLAVTAISSRDMEVKERLERLIYLSGGAKIKGKYVAGKEIFWR